MIQHLATPLAAAKPVKFLLGNKPFLVRILLQQAISVTVVRPSSMFIIIHVILFTSAAISLFLHREDEFQYHVFSR